MQGRTRHFKKGGIFLKKSPKTNREKEFFTQIKRDVYNSLALNKYKYLLTAVLFLFFCFSFKELYGSMVFTGLIENRPSFGDTLVYIFSGMKEFVPDPNANFEYPMIWLSCQVLICFLVGDYAPKDMTTYGQQYLIRSTHKSYWLIGKIIYCVLSVLTFYAVGYATVWCFNLFWGDPSIVFHDDVCGILTFIGTDQLTGTELFFGVFLLPVLTSSVLAVFQMTLSLLIKPIYSLLCTATYISASAYYLSYVFIGNYSMMLRSKSVVETLSSTGGNCFDERIAIAVDCILILMLYIVGMILMKKYDFLEKS